MYICLKAVTQFNLRLEKNEKWKLNPTQYGKKKTVVNYNLNTGSAPPPDTFIKHNSMVPWDCASLRCKNLCYTLPKIYLRCDQLYNHDAKITEDQIIIYNCTQLAFAPLLLLSMLNIIVLSLSGTVSIVVF